MLNDAANRELIELLNEILIYPYDWFTTEKHARLTKFLEELEKGNLKLVEKY